MDKRHKRYILLAWLLCGGLLLYAAFFTYMNGFSKISFSYEGNDICEVPKEILESGTTGIGEYIVEFPVDLSHYTINYLRLYVDGVEENNIRMYFVGYDKTWQPVVSITDYPLKNGEINIELSSQDFDLVGIVVYGTERNVIKEAQFRESLETKHPSRALSFIAKTLGAYLILTVPLIFVLICKTRRSQNVG